jgi:hypothetical protein
VLTSSFVEASLLKLVADLVILALISRHVEENTDYLRLALYIAVVAVGSALCTGTAVFVGFVITRMEGLLFSVCRTTTTTTTPQSLSIPFSHPKTCVVSLLPGELWGQRHHHGVSRALETKDAK